MTYEELLERLRAVWPARTIMTAMELSLFDALGEDGASAAGAAATMGTDPRATGLLLCALAGLGLVEKEGEHYRCAPLAADRLRRGSPTYGGRGLLHQTHLWESWSHLTDVVRTGAPARVERQRSADEYHDFVGAMYDFGWDRAVAVAGLVDLDGVDRMLDLGGGPGSYAIAFCQRKPALRAVVFDRPLALDVALELTTRHGVADRIELRPGDFTTDPVGADFDLVFASHIIHSYPPEANAALMREIHEALRPGGRLLLQDFFLEDDRVSPASSAVFAINMLVNTDGGRTYTWTEATDWLERAGFATVRRLDTPPGAGILEAVRD